MGYSRSFLILSFILLCVFIWKGYSRQITVEARLGERVIFQLPTPKRCSTSALSDPTGTVIFETSVYGNSLSDWAANRSRTTDYIDLGTYINFTIISVQSWNEGVYEYRPLSNAVNADCIRSYILRILVPVNGGWANWSSFGPCSVSCGQGLQTRSRSCTAPRPQYGGLTCSGEETVSQTCEYRPCPVNGGWADWSSFGPCSVSCGQGLETRSRSCRAPRPQYGGLNCSGEETESQTCEYRPCPVNGGWADWSSFGPCSVSCGQGLRTRNRSCTAPRPQYGGLNCSGPKTESRTCEYRPCPVDGGWSGWSQFPPCSLSCGQGSQTRWRSCNNPTPIHGGRTCPGRSTETRGCKVRSCPVDGQWSNWSAYGQCTVTCNTGVQTRNRSCSNPAPALGGRDCNGSSTDRIVCNDNLCPVHPAWSEWSDGACSVTCGQGLRNRTRLCLVDGQTTSIRNCTGPEYETEMCEEPPCPVDGAWSKWGNFSSCSKPCGTGMRFRTRNCSEPGPQFGGKTCPGVSKHTELCKERECAVDGSWSEWSSWTFCPDQCRTDLLKNRTRECDRPEPKYGGLDCDGNDTESRSCQRGQCDPQTSAISSDSPPMYVIIAGAAGLVAVVIIASVVIACCRRKSQKNKKAETRNDVIRTDSQRNRLTLFDNPTYNEIETDDNIYCEIPCGEQVETNELQSFRPQYEQLPGRCGDNDENTYTKVCPEREDGQKTHELPSCNTDSYLVPSPKIDSTYLTPSPKRDSYLTPSPKNDFNYLTPSPKHKRMSDGKDNHVDGDGICPDDGYMYITPVHGPSSSS